MRRITKARIKFISLVPAGANQFRTIYKDDGSVELNTIIKTSDHFADDGELTAVVYAPEVPDAQGDFASAPVIKAMAHEFARSGQGVDIRHNNVALPKDKAAIVESFIIAKGDERFVNFKDTNGNVVDVTGGWATVIKIEDAELRKLYREGKWSGVSMGGEGAMEVVKEDNGGIIAAITKLVDKLTGRKTEEDDMKKEELEAALKASNTELATAIVTGVVTGITKILNPGTTATETDADKTARLAKEAAAKGEQPPVFTGDPLKLEDVNKHLLAVRAFDLKKSIDWSKPDAVATYATQLADIQKAAAGGKSEKDLAIENLEKKLTELRGRSNQPLDGGNDDQPVSFTNLSKEDAASVSAAEAAAKAINAERGYKTA